MTDENVPHLPSLPEKPKKSFPWAEIGRWTVVVTIGLAVVTVLAFTVYKAVTDEPDWKRAERVCREACPSYNAEFVRVMETPRHDYECWCRRGTEPLRIW